jgi:hypothetical protein
MKDVRRTVTGAWISGIAVVLLRLDNVEWPFVAT